MEFDEREQHIANLISGIVCCNLGGKVYVIHEAPPLDKIVANQIHKDRMMEAELRGVLSNDELVNQLMSLGLWTINDQTELDTMPKRIENMKVQLYNAYFNYKDRDALHKNLNRLKKKHIKLVTKRDRLKRESAEGIATTSKNKYLISSNITDINNNKLWNSEDYWKQDSKLIDALVREYMNAMIDEDDMRELSRTEPWRTLWGVSKTEKSLFGLPAIMLTSEQKSLVMWSRIYDSVYESMECPPEEVVTDNDMLDGWLILQSRKRDDERKKKHGFGNDKDVKGQEVFLFSDTAEGAQRITEKNDAAGRAMFNQRMSALKKSGGKIDVTQLPDSKLSIRQQAMGQAKTGN